MPCITVVLDVSEETTGNDLISELEEAGFTVTDPVVTRCLEDGDEADISLSEVLQEGDEVDIAALDLSDEEVEADAADEEPEEDLPAGEVG